MFGAFRRSASASGSPSPPRVAWSTVPPTRSTPVPVTTSFRDCSSSSCWAAWVASVERWWPASSWSRLRTSSAWSGHRCGHRSPSFSCSCSCCRFVPKVSSVSQLRGSRNVSNPQCTLGVGPRRLLALSGRRHQPRLPQHRCCHVDFHGVCHVVEYVLGLLGLRGVRFGRLLRDRRLHDGAARESSEHGRRRGDVLARSLGRARRDGGGGASWPDRTSRATSHVRRYHDRDLLRVPAHRHQPEFHRWNRRVVTAVRSLGRQLLRGAVLLRRTRYLNLRGHPVGTGATVPLRASVARHS